MIITKTPFRLSFFGGGTDYRPWFEEEGGLIIASAFTQSCYISIRPLPPFFDHKTRIVYSKIEEVKHFNEINHPSIKNCLKYLNIESGLEIHHDGDLPARSGIGSSSSFTVGLLKALHALNYRHLSKKQLADEAIHVEQNVIKEDVGIQDQIMAAYGGLKVIKMGPGSDYSVSPLILPPDYQKNLESHVLLGFSGINRYATEFAKSQIEKIRAGKNRSQLSEIMSLAEEALSQFQSNNEMKDIGKLLDNSWKLKQTLSNDISNNYINELYETAIKNGAFGGKLLGAGGGGFIMFLAPPECHNSIKEALSEIKVWVPFKIDMEGSQILFHNDITLESNQQFSTIHNKL